MSNASTKPSHGSHVDWQFAVRPHWSTLPVWWSQEPLSWARRNWTANVFRTVRSHQFPTENQWPMGPTTSNDHEKSPFEVIGITDRLEWWCEWLLGMKWGFMSPTTLWRGTTRWSLTARPNLTPVLLMNPCTGIMVHDWVRSKDEILSCEEIRILNSGDSLDCFRLFLVFLPTPLIWKNCY